MGIFGAVFATGLAPIISMMILSPHILKKRNGFHFARCLPQPGRVGKILSSGLPSLVTESSSGIVMIVFNSIIMGLEGNVGVAAYGVIANLSLVIIAVYTGIAQGIQPLISRSYGAGRREEMLVFLRYALAVMAVFSVVIYACVFLWASPIAAVFNSENNARLQEIAREGLRLYFTACPFAGFNVIIAVYFTSGANPLPAHIISLLRGFVVIIPMAFLLSSAAGLAGVWCTFPVTEALVAVLGVLFFIRAKKRPASMAGA